MVGRASEETKTKMKQTGSWEEGGFQTGSVAGEPLCPAPVAGHLRIPCAIRLRGRGGSGGKVE